MLHFKINIRVTTTFVQHSFRQFKFKILKKINLIEFHL